jgi:L-ascorbate metabolism protein UlaG (beta-lactamase superfamily)
VKPPVNQPARHPAPAEDARSSAATARPAARHRAWRRLAIAAAVVLPTLVLAACGALRWPAFGAAFSPHAGERLQAVRASPQWQGRAFDNPQRSWVDVRGGLWDAAFAPANPDAVPQAPVEVVRPVPAALAQPPASGLRVTWFGHSSTLLELGAVRVLIDPVWSARASPVDWIGPQRWYEAPLALSELPPIDAVLISHDHYDHLDMRTIQAMRDWHTRFIVPLGVGAHLERWGIAPARIQELDWWQQTAVGEVRVTATPARHSSGRLSNASNQTLWAGFALHGARHAVWFSGDTGQHDTLAEIGERLGPFDLTLVDAGEYDGHWPDAHLGPEMALQAHRLVGGRRMVPVHWGLMQLAPHTWTEPAERVLQQAACSGQDVRVLQPGRPSEPLVEAVATARWWPALPVRSARQAPILGTVDGDPLQRVAVPDCTASPVPAGSSVSRG